MHRCWSQRKVIRIASVVFVGLGVVILGGCGSGPSRVRAPKINASRAAKDAMSLYDADGDGFLAGAELDKASGLKASMKTLDTNSDGKVDAAEIEARIETWLQSSAGVSQVLCYVTIDKQPLAGATVTFEPEPFLADDIESAVATTNSYGVASPSIPPEQRKQKDMPYGLRLGFYKVRVSLEKNGKQLIPARYNTETILGQQVAGDDPAILSHRIPLDLKSR